MTHKRDADCVVGNKAHHVDLLWHKVLQSHAKVSMNAPSSAKTVAQANILLSIMLKHADGRHAMSS